MKILVLGGTRLVGKLLVKKLIDAGHNVTIVTRGLTKDNFGNRVNRIILDLMNSKDVYNKLPRDYYDVVYDMMVLTPDNVKERLSILYCKKYVMVSTDGVYTNRHLDIKEHEFYPSEIMWSYCGYIGVDYDTRKRFAEAALLGDFSEIQSIRVRFPVVIAADEYTGRLKWYVNHVINSEEMNIKNLFARRPFISSEEAAEFLFSLSDFSNIKVKEAYSGRLAINVSNEGILSQYELLNIISNCSGKEFDESLLSDNCFDMSPFGNVDEYSLNIEYAKSIIGEFKDITIIMKRIISELIEKEIK